MTPDRKGNKRSVGVSVSVASKEPIKVSFMMMERPHTHTQSLPLLFPRLGSVIPAKAGIAILTVKAFIFSVIFTQPIQPGVLSGTLSQNFL